jgi:CheY-like chemotaxis protein
MVGSMNLSVSPSSSSGSAPIPVHILIVDDDPAIRRVTRTLVEFLGYTASEATNGHEGLKLFKTLAPDVVLLDMLMPEKDGIETLRDIREIDPVTPIIAMSGGSRIDAIVCLRFASNLGAPLVLLKPFTADELSATLELALKNRTAARNAGSRPVDRTA